MKAINTVCIVGNGPSVFDAGLGARIDSMDAVIRIHEWAGKYPDDFGTKYTYGILPGPWLLKAMGQAVMAPDEGFLCYNFKNQRSKEPCPDFFMDRKTHVFRNSIDVMFKEILRRGLAPTRGICAIYMAAMLLKPETIYLAGFDSVMSGIIVQYHDLSGQKLADHFIGKEMEERHDFSYESRMLDVIRKKTGVQIKSIMEG